METYVVLGIIAAVVAGAVFYICRAKKKGKCIGCSKGCASCQACSLKSSEKSNNQV